jgi:hypothetical protein
MTKDLLDLQIQGTSRKLRRSALRFIDDDRWNRSTTPTKCLANTGDPMQNVEPINFARISPAGRLVSKSNRVLWFGCLLFGFDLCAIAPVERFAHSAPDIERETTSIRE